MQHHPCFRHLQCLLILVLLLMSASRTGAAVDHREFIYDGFSGDNLNLTMDGQASVVDGLLRLTSGLPYSKGHAFYPYPLNFTDVPNGSSLSSFSTTFIFSIMGPSTDLSSPGLAFVLCSSTNLSSAYPDQFLGLLNPSNNGNATNHLLAIELDTVINTEFRDIDSNHIGIDLNSLISVVSHTAGYYDSDGVFRNLSLVSREPMQVWVDYDGRQTMLNVTMAPCCPSSKPSKPLLSVVYDLSSVLPTELVFAGFSFANDLLIGGKHYVLGWSFKPNEEAAALNYSLLSLNTTTPQLPTKIHPRPRSNKTILCAILLPVLGIVIVVSAALLMVHMKRRSKSRTAQLEWEREYGPPSFTYRDLLAATGGFKDKMLLGKGGFGSVFRGVLHHSKQTVGIKRVSPESKQGMKEFMAEILILGKLLYDAIKMCSYLKQAQKEFIVGKISFGSYHVLLISATLLDGSKH